MGRLCMLCLNHGLIVGQEIENQSDMRLKVSELIEEQTGQWDMQQLTRLFNQYQIQEIVATDNKPNLQARGRDRLIWQHAKNGKYTVKEGYKVLLEMRNEPVAAHVFDWQLIWRQKSLEPKVKIFLWRLMHKGLPMATNLHRRMNNFNPMCQRCGLENEFEMHCLFYCETSRQIWFASPVGIRVHELPLDIVHTCTQVLGCLDEDGAKLFANTMWEIWKERNKAVIEHEVFKTRAVIQRVKVGMSMADMSNCLQGDPSNTIVWQKYEYYPEGWQVLVDASWESSMKSGRAFVVYHRGILHSVGLRASDMHDPFYAEASGLAEAMQYVYDKMQIPMDTMVQFFSDCSNLVLAINQADTTDLPSWRAVPAVNEIIWRIENASQGPKVQHAKREALQQPHGLANAARRGMMNYEGPPTLMMQQVGKLTEMIDDNFFQRVQEAPPPPLIYLVLS
ncbi:hypothetical protein LUZ61_005556 [Rhynchospora tenuis]|uniref:Reverse transcriptase zinc-binding domain-containing protein n=1 Tax=Rhynchospora tenuis TaxID=198213 RepID=A0AAD5ZPV3_9POAL|nr:hypothetical protein LUZ61_005556 [Rhynchospora tenuis]